MASELYNTIDALSKEKGIDPQIVVSAVEDAIVVATRKYYKTQETLRAELDKDTGKINAFAIRLVVETPEQVEDPLQQISLEEARKINPSLEVGGELRIPKVTEGILGRIAAQLAKQVIFQKVREAERDTVFNDYSPRINEVVSASVKRVEGPDVIFDMGKTEARMPRKEQSRLESFAVGERIRVVIVRVERASKGPGVIVSRAAPELVQHLFQTEVPEIYDGTVVIRAIAREAGERTKIAVLSKDKDVDAVGACVGMKGMRVQSIIRELRGEKIDIIEFHEDAVTFAEKALQPAKVSRVTIVDSADKQLEVVVDDSQLSLAIGKKGQNVRLAAKLLGWKIDIKSEEEKRQEVERQMAELVPNTATPLADVSGLGDGLVEKLAAAGVTTVEALADMTPEQLEAIEGIGPKTVEKISIAVNNYFSSLEAAEAEASAEVPEDVAAEPDADEPGADEPAAEHTSATETDAEPEAEAALQTEVGAEPDGEPELKASTEPIAEIEPVSGVTAESEDIKVSGKEVVPEIEQASGESDASASHAAPENPEGHEPSR